MEKTDEPKISERSLPKFLEQLGISIAFRTGDALNSDSKAAGERLEADFKGIASFSWAQNNNLAQQLIDDITNCSEERWQGVIIGWLALTADLGIEAIRRDYPGQPEIVDWCPKCKARLTLSCLHPNVPHRDSISDFAAWTRQFCLELIAKGAKGPINTQWLDGIFTLDLAASQMKINKLLFAIGGDKLVTDVSAVAKDVHKTLSKDPVIRLVLELIGAQTRITTGSEESDADLKSIVQRTQGTC